MSALPDIPENAWTLRHPLPRRRDRFHSLNGSRVLHTLRDPDAWPRLTAYCGESRLVYEWYRETGEEPGWELCAGCASEKTGTGAAPSTTR